MRQPATFPIIPSMTFRRILLGRPAGRPISPHVASQGYKHLAAFCEILNLFEVDNFVLVEDNTSKTIHELRQKIRRIQDELGQMNGPVSDIPELINSTNILRANEQLTRVDNKKTELLEVYGQYTQILTDAIMTIIRTQNKIAEIRKKQASAARTKRTGSKSKRRRNTTSKKLISNRGG